MGTQLFARPARNGGLSLLSANLCPLCPVKAQSSPLPCSSCVPPRKPGGFRCVHQRTRQSFFVQVATRAGQAVLVTARSKDPRSFKSPLQAMVLLKQVGIVTGQFDLTQYSPDQHETAPRSRRRPAKPSKLGLRWNRIAESISSPAQPSLDDPSLDISEEQTRRLIARQENQQLSLLGN